MNYYNEVMPSFWESIRKEKPGYAQTLLNQYRANRGLAPYQILPRKPQKPRGLSAIRAAQKALSMPLPGL